MTKRPSAAGKAKPSKKSPSQKNKAAAPCHSALSPNAQTPDAQASDHAGGSKSAATVSELAAGLYLAATPIGNLRDITLRVLDALKGADIVACEDTRTSSKLLSRYGIDAPLWAYHEHNAEKMRPRILERLAQGARVVLISDAGTPLVSDPGYKLVQDCIARELPVTALPGPSAAVTALILSGLPCDRFLFAGFLPPKSAARRKILSELAQVPSSLIFYEAPQRLPESLADMAAVLGPRPAAVARELTKMFEEVRREKLDALAAYYAENGPPRGEVAVVVDAPLQNADGVTDAEVDQKLDAALSAMRLRDAVDVVVGSTGRAKRDVYARALARQKDRR